MRELIHEIKTYKARLLGRLFEDYNSKESPFVWDTVMFNLNKLDNEIKIDGFAKKYSAELTATVGIAALVALSIYAISSGGINSPDRPTLPGPTPI